MVPSEILISNVLPMAALQLGSTGMSVCKKRAEKAGSVFIGISGTIPGVNFYPQSAFPAFVRMSNTRREFLGRRSVS